MSAPLRHAAAVLLVTVLAAGVQQAQAQDTSEPAPEGDVVAQGRDLYLIGCSSCHGAEGEGVVIDGERRGPPLLESGEAAAYYYLATGRMPLGNSNEQPQRKEPAYSEDEIDALVTYIASISTGPRLPDIDTADADLAEGGELFRANCAPCHSASGAGGALSYGRAAPSLHESEPSQVGAAVRAGPGQMPAFSEDTIDDEQLAGIVSYVEYLRNPEDPGGVPLGRIGPIPEGLVAWTIAVTALLAMVFLIGVVGAPVTLVKADRWVLWCFVLSVLASIGLAIVYWNGGQPQWEGALLAVALGGIGAAIVLWAQAYMPGGEVVEHRGRLESSDDDVDAFVADFEVGEESLRQRRALLAAGAAAVAAFGAALLFPIRSLGPPPGKDLKVTAFRQGARVVGGDGEPLKPSDLAVDGVVTVWPDGHVGAADSPTLLIRVRDQDEIEPSPGREDWAVQGVIAYSKLCTHTGCPVGLYQAEDALLLCPCHQSTFDVLRGAKPVFGPAARALPQLPLGLDAEGFLVAQGDFSSPVGPGFWDRGR